MNAKIKRLWPLGVLAALSIVGFQQGAPALSRSLDALGIKAANGNDVTIKRDLLVTRNITATTDSIRIIPVIVGDTDVAASQSAVAWGITPGSDVGGSQKGITTPRAGSIIGISVLGNTACTAGSLIADATIDGTVQGVQTGLNTHTGSTITSNTVQLANVKTFTANQAIGAKITTDSGWLPITDDVVVAVYIKLN